MTQVFPALPGLAWSATMTPIWQTNIHTAASGLEAAGSCWSYPNWKFSATYEFLRADVTQELQQLVAFFCLVGGRRDAWLYSHPRFNTCAGQPFGTGDGATATFQLARSFGGWAEPCRSPNQIGAIYRDGAALAPGAWSVDDFGVVTLAAPPAPGVVVSADFTYYFRCRFCADTVDFEEFLYNLWSTKSIEFQSVKV